MTDNYKIFHPTVVGYTFFSSVHRTFAKLNQILGYKEGLKQKIEIIRS
jgi:hypothetical protein